MPRISQPTHITPKQFQVLEQIGNFQRSQCYSATIGELAKALNISRATAYEHIAALRGKKLLAASTGKARCLRLSENGERLLDVALEYDEPSQTVENSCAEELPEPITLRGRVCAGYGIDAIEEQQPFSLGQVFGNQGDVFALQVSGNSMIDAGIHSGDYVMCRQANTANNGELVIALLDDGENATVKRFFKNEQAIRLQPENDAFEPIFSKNCRIQAIVVGVVRQF
ncbi:MAG: transcriptional repressor LexA [Planctomycetota bacterium]|jgi:repressor LexA